MLDEIHDRAYRNGRDQLHSDIDQGLAKLGSAVLTTFRTMQAIHFAAPWKKRRKDVRCA